MNIVEFTKISRAYRHGRNVVDDVSFTVGSGEVVGLLGRNGAGKTTLLRMAMGMIRPHHGSVRVFGLDPVADGLQVKRRVGYVSEDQMLPARASVGEVVDLHRALFPDWDDRLAVELLEKFDLTPRPRIMSLSKGQARQVALVCAVAHRPELLILDEPGGGLDSVARREFLEAAVRLLAESGTAILFSSHHMNDVERLAGRVILLHEQQVMLDSELDELRENFSLAVLSSANGLEPERLIQLPGCFRARRQGEALHAVFQVEPETVRQTLQSDLGVEAARCTRLPLEELFIELAGGTSS